MLVILDVVYNVLNILYASSNVVAGVIPYFFKVRRALELKYKAMQPRQPLKSPKLLIFFFHHL